MLCDLHTHTTASDGQYTPTELVGLAKARGLSVLAVTDHDTIAGVTEAQRAGNELDLTVIRGVELSAKDYPNCHILGYRFQDGDTELARLCERFRAGRDERKYKIVDFLREKGVDINLAEVEEIAGGEVIARPHFAQALVRRGYVSSNREAFDRYLDTEEFRRRVKRFKATRKPVWRQSRPRVGKCPWPIPIRWGCRTGSWTFWWGSSETGGWTLSNASTPNTHRNSSSFTSIWRKSISCTRPAAATSTANG